MKKLAFLVIVLVLTACGSSNEVLPTLMPTAGIAGPTPEPTQTPRPTPTPLPPTRPRPTATPKPLVMEGRGDGVWDLETGGGVYIVSGWHGGDSNFIVTVYDAITGDLVGVPINCIADCENVSVQRLRAGKYLIEIMADGPWAVYWDK